MPDEFADLNDLVSSLKASVNPPGTDYFDATNPQWVAALGNAFWWARLQGYFTAYRLNADGDQIVPAVSGDGTPELPRELQQIIVLVAAMNTLESKVLSFATKKRVKAGPVESETQQDARPLLLLLQQRRQELEDIRVLLLGSRYHTMAGIVDLAIEREGQFMSGQAGWLR